jgi:RNA polymerase sigma factor (sigma-70 family)
MAAGQLNPVMRHLRRVALLQDGAGLTDAQLLEGFLARREEAAFAALVRRHGPMVFGVCRRVLGDIHDAEDAFQATFLLLVRKAASIVRREQVGGWLYRVAYRTALEAREIRARRRARERQVDAMPEPEAFLGDVWHGLQPLLDEELARLPEKYRVPILLCDLEGQTRKEVARQLKLPEGRSPAGWQRAGGCWLSAWPAAAWRCRWGRSRRSCPRRRRRRPCRPGW